MIELQEKPASHLYAIRPDRDYYLFTGVAADGRQVLMGPDFPAAVVLFFHPDGTFEEVRSLMPAPGDPPAMADPDGLMEAHFRKLQETTGCSPATIQVRRFLVDASNAYPNPEEVVSDFAIGIFDHPFSYRDLAANPERFQEFTEEDARYYLQLLAEWVERGDFVLEWGNEFHLNKDGYIVAS